MIRHLPPRMRSAADTLEAMVETGAVQQVELEYLAVCLRQWAEDIEAARGRPANVVQLHADRFPGEL